MTPLDAARRRALFARLWARFSAVDSGFSLQPAAIMRLLGLMRWLAAGLITLALVLMACFGQATSPVVWSLPALLIVFNLWLYGRTPTVHARYALVGHLGFDTLVLFALFWAIDGATNPFISLFLLPVAFAGAALDIRGAAMVTWFSILAYTGLLGRYLAHLGHPMRIIGFERHVIGMWLTFVLAAFLLCGFLLALAARLRAGERELVAQRERLVRDDAVVSVATVAAGAAHALNTPLSTILIAAESLAEDTSLTADTREEAAVIRDQAELAAGELRALVAARDPRAQNRVAAGVFVDDVLARWRARRPEIELSVTATPAAGPVVRNDPALAQALHNLLDNAADAALAAYAPRLAVTRTLDEHELTLAIDDPGPVAVERLARGEPGSTKPGGLGLGLTLARASLARLGAQLVFEAGPNAGTRTRVVLCLAALAPERG